MHIFLEIFYITYIKYQLFVYILYKSQLFVYICVPISAVCLHLYTNFSWLFTMYRQLTFLHCKLQLNFDDNKLSSLRSQCKNETFLSDFQPLWIFAHLFATPIFNGFCWIFSPMKTFRTFHRFTRTFMLTFHSSFSYFSKARIVVGFSIGATNRFVHRSALVRTFKHLFNS